MTSFKDRALRQSLIMEHYQKPRFRDLENHAQLPFQVHVKAKHCVDKIDLAFAIDKDLTIGAVSFRGEGCAIFLASADLVLTQVKGKSISQVKKLLENYEKMLKEGDTKHLDFDLGNLVIFDNVKAHLNRLNCALLVKEAFELAWQTFNL